MDDFRIRSILLYSPFVSSSIFSGLSCGFSSCSLPHAASAHPKTLQRYRANFFSKPYTLPFAPCTPLSTLRQENGSQNPSDNAVPVCFFSYFRLSLTCFLFTAMRTILSRIKTFLPTKKPANTDVYGDKEV